MYDPTISVEGNRFLFIGFQSWRGWDHSGSEPYSPMRPSTSPTPHQYISQKYAQKFPISLSVLKLAMQTVLYPLWKVHSWFLELPSSHRSFLLQDLGYIVLSVHVVVQENMYHVVLDYGKVQEGTHPKKVASLYVLQRRKSLQSQHSQLQFSIPGISH